MKSIELKVDDDNFQIMMNILNNLKDGLIKNLNIKEVDSLDIEVVNEDENDYKLMMEVKKNRDSKDFMEFLEELN